MLSESLYPKFTNYILILSLSLVALIALGCAAKNQPMNSPPVNGVSLQTPKNLDALANADLTQNTAETINRAVSPCSTEPVDCDTDENTFEVNPALLANCKLPPICAGGLLKQSAGADQINTYIARYKVTFPLTCRFTQPPRCYSGQKRTCTEECTP